MFKTPVVYPAVDPEDDRDLIARINEARSNRELVQLTLMADARLKLRARMQAAPRARSHRGRLAVLRGQAAR